MLLVSSLYTFFLLVLSIIKRWLLTSPTVIMDSFIHYCSSVYFCFICFEDLLLGTKTLRLWHPLYHYEITFFNPFNIFYSEIYMNIATAAFIWLCHIVYFYHCFTFNFCLLYLKWDVYIWVLLFHPVWSFLTVNWDI